MDDLDLYKKLLQEDNMRKYYEGEIPLEYIYPEVFDYKVQIESGWQKIKASLDEEDNKTNMG